MFNFNIFNSIPNFMKVATPKNTTKLEAALLVYYNAIRWHIGWQTMMIATNKRKGGI
jgi:hypothetical protein